MSIKNPLIENKKALGMFRNSSKIGKEGYWEFCHLVGYVIFPSMNWDKGCMTMSERDVAACVVIYRDHVLQLITLSYYELKMLDDYTDISNLPKSDQSKINSLQKASSSKIEEFVREKIKTYIESCKEETDKFCNKWPMRSRFLKAIEEIENNIDQLYILKTDFYGE